MVNVSSHAFSYEHHTFGQSLNSFIVTDITITETQTEVIYRLWGQLSFCPKCYEVISKHGIW